MIRHLRQVGVALSLVLMAATSCYTPDLTKEIYLCDRGKCPEDFYCIDNKYCTKKLDECVVGGVQISDTVTACVGRADVNNANSACAGGASVSKCDMQMFEKNLCTGINICSYCCR
ncbi:MAG TPA: hypothetical protein PKI03_36125 [Pseudomonadota bacterium]|nr:hypothetical protein [Pseudomonadota bacterium]